MYNCIIGIRLAVPADSVADERHAVRGGERAGGAVRGGRVRGAVRRPVARRRAAPADRARRRRHAGAPALRLVCGEMEHIAIYVYCAMFTLVNLLKKCKSREIGVQARSR